MIINVIINTTINETTKLIGSTESHIFPVISLPTFINGKVLFRIIPNPTRPSHSPPPQGIPSGIFPDKRYEIKLITVHDKLIKADIIIDFNIDFFIKFSKYAQKYTIHTIPQNQGK